MDIATEIKTVTLAALLVLLSACGDSNGLYEAPATDTVPGSADGIKDTELPGADETGDNANSTAPTDGAVDAGTTDSSTPDTTQPADDPDVNAMGLATTEQARFVTSDCGSLPISAAVHSNTMSAPTAMTVGELVSGVIGADTDTTNNEHYWSIALEPGHYHVVLDSRRTDGGFSDLGLTLTDVQDTGAVDLFTGDGTDFRLRSHAYFRVAVARTLILRLTPNDTAEAYTFGVFDNGSAVPSPLFHDCPAIKPLSLDTTEAVILPLNNSSTDDRWYLVELEAGEYEVNSQGTRIDGLSSPVQYKLTQFDQFGQNERLAHFSYVDQAGPVSINNIDQLKRYVSGPTWIRIQNYNGDLNMEITINSGI